MYRLPQWKLDAIKLSANALKASKKDLETIAATIEIEYRVPVFHSRGHLYLEPCMNRTEAIKLF